MVLAAIYRSPSFLYRTELGADTNADEVELTSDEIASALSFLITGLPPDDTLRALARRDALVDREIVRAEAARLLETDAARTQALAFFRSYAHLGELTEDGKNPEALPAWSPALHAAMHEQFDRHVARVLFDGDGGLRALLAEPEVEIDPRLAPLYGRTVSTWSVQTLDRTEYAGLLTLPAVMAALAHPTSTSPVHRGLFVRRDLLCHELPLPPAGATNMNDRLLSPDPQATQREHYEHFARNNPSCASCHATFQPLGLSFERFDAIGAYRDRTEHGRPIEVGGRLEAAEDADGEFAGPGELVRRVIDSDVGRRCLTQRYATYAFGVDAHGLRTLLAHGASRLAADDLRFESLVLAVVESDVFYRRRVE